MFRKVLNLRKYLNIWAIVVIASLLFTGAAHAYSLEIAGGQRQGEVLYQIGGLATTSSGARQYLHFPLSELRFPLNSSVLGLTLGHRLDSGSSLRIMLVQDVGSVSGAIKDSDWGINHYLIDPMMFPLDSLDIYSESKAELNGRDVTVEWMTDYDLAFLSVFNLKMEIGVGLLHQLYKYKISNTLQSYPSTPAVPSDYIPGSTGYYEYESIFPYLKFQMKKRFASQSALSFSASYSPFLRANDFDNHLLRNKTSNGESEGYGIRFEGKAGFQLSRLVSMTIGLDYFKTIANGTQVQKSIETGVYTETTIGLRNIGEQATANLAFLVNF